MKVEFTGEGANGTLKVDGVLMDNATMFTLVARAGELPIAIIEAYVDMDSPVVMDVERIVWIVESVTHVPGDARLEITAEASAPDEWRVRRVHDDTPVKPPMFDPDAPPEFT